MFLLELLHLCWMSLAHGCHKPQAQIRGLKDKTQHTPYIVTHIQVDRRTPDNIQSNKPWESEDYGVQIASYFATTLFLKLDSF